MTSNYRTSCLRRFNGLIQTYQMVPLVLVCLFLQVLIIGGGDGGVLREVVKHPMVESVVQCEIDEVCIGFPCCLSCLEEQLCRPIYCTFISHIKLCGYVSNRMSLMFRKSTSLEWQRDFLAPSWLWMLEMDLSSWRRIRMLSMSSLRTPQTLLVSMQCKIWHSFLPLLHGEV